MSRNVPGREHMQAWRAFLELHAQTVRTLEAELREECDLPLGWYDVLVQLSEQPGTSLRMADLADAVLLSRSGLTRLVDRMCDAGYVVRQTVEGDRRGTLVCLTTAGQETLRRCAPVHLRGIDEHFARHLGTAEARSLRDVLLRVLDAER